MNPNFAHFCNLLLDRSGLELHENKGYLVETRLGPIANRLGVKNVDALLTRLQFAPDQTLITECVEAMATHESSFFRDTVPYVQLSNIILPRILEQKSLSRSLRIWSAACSTGQEPYSIAMTLEDYATELHDWHVEILATDMVAKAVNQAQKGFYTDFEVGRGLKDMHRDRWFRKVEGGYMIDPTLRRHMHFHTHNLLDSIDERGPFDIVFCRNVLIYFTREKKIQILNRISSVLAPDGLLILGSAETVIGLCDTYESYQGQHGLFRRKLFSPA